MQLPRDLYIFSSLLYIRRILCISEQIRKLKFPETEKTEQQFLLIEKMKRDGKGSSTHKIRDSIIRFLPRRVKYVFYVMHKKLGVYLLANKPKFITLSHAERIV